MRDLHAIYTPENVRVELELAGLAARGLAWAIDLAVTSVLIACSSALVAAFGVVFAGFARALYFVALFAIQWGYSATLEWRWHGQTVGKRWLGLRVVSARGMPIGFGAAALRNLLRVIDILPGAYGVAAVSVLWDARARRIGDIAADTIVIHTRVVARPVVSAPQPVDDLDGASAAWLQAARALTAQERDVVSAVTRRRERLPFAARYALFARLAQHLEQRLGIERPLWLAPERFVTTTIAAPARAADPTKAQRT